MTETLLPLAQLLPLRSLVVTLQCLQSCDVSFFHQPAINAFLRNLLDHPKNFDQYLVADTPESGRVGYQVGDYYRFTVIALAGGEALLRLLVERLHRLPFSVKASRRQGAFCDNWRLLALHDAFNEQSVTGFDELSTYTCDVLQEESSQWAQQPSFAWHWLAPARLLKDKAQRGKATGEQRYCRNASDISTPLLLGRLYDTLAQLLRNRGLIVPPRPQPPNRALAVSHIFWLDTEYHHSNGDAQAMGGMLGFQSWQACAQMAVWWPLLVLGQYTGVGQRRSFGWGRYELVTRDGGVTYRRGLPASPLLARVIDDENLWTAYQHVSKSQRRHQSKEFDDEEEDDEEAIPSADADRPACDDLARERLHKLAGQLLNQSYAVPALQGWRRVKPDGGERLLMVPPFWDRVLQRAVVQIISPALEKVMSSHSYGYRPGRSRVTAKSAIQKAWREGYRWVFESDINDFFPSVNCQRVYDRLRALFYDDPLLEQIAAWLAAPLMLDGEVRERVGLPQGAPLSPMLANLLLDDFDSDMQTAGFRLIRFADDFVVMCKSEDEARRAHAYAVASLSEHQLHLKPEKTRQRPMDQGFTYLGYVFVNDMALDVGGGTQSAVAALRDNHWLAQVASRPGQAIDGPESLDAFCRNKIVDPETTLQVGQRRDSGTFLCVTGTTSLISTHQGRVRVERDDKVIAELPWQGLQAVLLIGPHHITTPALRAAMENDVPVHFAAASGFYQGASWSGEPQQPGWGLWVLQQQRAESLEFALVVAKSLVRARLQQQAETLRQRQLDGSKEIRHQLDAVERATTLSSLNGIEGSAARRYFAALSNLLSSEWQFGGRRRRPPPDPFNVLLSLGYTQLYAYTDCLLRVDGLLPWQGFYHQARGKHAALASDLMEPFRHIVERVALTQISRGSLTPADFNQSANGCQMHNGARRAYMAALQARFDSPTRSKGREQPESVFQQLHRQNLSLIAWLQGDEPFHAWSAR